MSPQATSARSRSRSASANRSLSICRATSRTCWLPIRRSPMRSSVQRAAPTSSAVAVGQTNVYFFDAEGQQIAGFDIAVTRDLNGIRAAIRQVLPDCDINVEGIGDGVMLAGHARRARPRRSRPMISRRGCSMSGPPTRSGRAVRSSTASPSAARDQVMLKVTVAEVERDLVKQLGINLSGQLGYGTAVVNFNNTNPFSASRSAAEHVRHHRRLQERQRHLAGHGAGRRHSHAGRAEPDRDFRRDRDLPGRRRIPDAQRLQLLDRHGRQQRATCQPAIDFKKFGVSLNFTPVVLSEGRISLKVMTEVSRTVAQQLADHHRARHRRKR